VPVPTLDRDGDGIPDLVEIANGLDPLFADDAALDADGEQAVGIDDLLLMQRHLTGLIVLDAQAVSRGDYDRDGSLSIAELVVLQGFLSEAP
jgi:hypothetical protein